VGKYQLILRTFNWPVDSVDCSLIRIFQIQLKIKVHVLSTVKKICSLELLKELEMIISFTQNLHCTSLGEDS